MENYEKMNKKEKCSITQKGRIVIHKNGVEKRIFAEEFSQYQPHGWERGASESHRKNNSRAKKGCVPYNKGISCSEATKAKISASLMGNTPWNKGMKLPPLSDSTKQKLSQIRKGKKKSEEWKAKLSESHKGKGYRLSADKLKIKIEKTYLTKKRNNSFNKSGIEESFYSELLSQNVNKTVYRQYKDDRYPYYCDFYILEDDLFIELNAHWTHGGRPYDPNDKECQEQLALWQEKAKTSQFYANAIITWTIRDVEKQRCAKEKNLNYKVIY